MPAMTMLRDPIRDLFFDANGNRWMLPAGLGDPEPVSRAERRSFGVNAGLGILIQAAKTKSYAGAANLARQGLLQMVRLRGDQADAYACCYWGTLLGKFLGFDTARQYILVHEGTQNGQSRRERSQDVFNLSYGLEQVFRLAPPGLPLDPRGGADSLAGRSLAAARNGQLLVLGK
jgi:hypothetical protein